MSSEKAVKVVIERCDAENNVTINVTKVHSAPNLKSLDLECPHCTAQFRNEKILSEHLKKHSGKVCLSSPLPEKRFKNEKILSEHLRKHSGKVHLSSSLPEKRFKNEKILSEHLRKHSGKVHLSSSVPEKRFECHHCAAIFSTKQYLAAHIGRHLKPLTCPRCPSTFLLVPDLKAHLLTHSSGKYTCEYCAASFKSKSLVASHLIYHSTEKPYTCKHCGKAFKRSHVLKRHSVLHCKEGNRSRSKLLSKVDRNLDLKKFPKTNAVEKVDANLNLEKFPKTNAMEKVDPNLNLEKLPETNDIEKADPNLSLEKFPKTNEIAKVHSCSYCSRDFKEKRQLVRHMTAHHSDKVLHCSKTFERKQRFKQQQKDCGSSEKGLRVGTMKQIYHCKFCTAGFKTEALLFSHSIKHSTERPFACPLCPKKSKRKSHLKEHLFWVHSIETRRSQHTNSDVKGSTKYFCQHCPVQCESKRSLAYHLATHSTETAFLCPYCSLTFKRQWHLDEHLVSHSSEKNLPSHSKIEPIKKVYSCHHCSAEFKTKKALRPHVIAHLEEKGSNVDSPEKSSALEDEQPTTKKSFSCSHCPGKFCLSSLDLYYLQKYDCAF